MGFARMTPEIHLGNIGLNVSSSIDDISQAECMQQDVWVKGPRCDDGECAIIIVRPRMGDPVRLVCLYSSVRGAT